MYPEMKYEEITEKLNKDEYIIIDVRTNKEFRDETIPGSINMPIFNDEERVEIGTAYTKESKEVAKTLGIEAVSRRLPSMFKEILELNKQYPHLVFFCSRGGFRSSSIVSLLRSLKIDAIKLTGGYKAYRNYINEHLEEQIQEINLIVLYGNTGTGKTHVLEELKNLGADVIDLEKCANHRGSTLGSVGLGEPNSQKMFESLLYDELVRRKSNTIFTEGESKRIGKSVIPDTFFEKMKSGRHVKISCPLDIRVDNILRDYVHETDDELIEALNYLRKRMGNDLIDSFIENVKLGNYKEVISDLMVKYYDPMYEHHVKNYIFHVENLNPLKTAEILINEFINKTETF